MRFVFWRNMVKRKTADFNSFICFDFETTGLAQNSRVIEIGAVKVRDGHLVSRYSSLVDPGIAIEPVITRITGINDEMVAGKPKVEELIPSFYAYTEGLPLVAHNAPFDCRFLERDALAAGYRFDHDVFDTLSFARRILPGLASYRLADLTAYLGIRHDQAHRAWCDAEAAARLYMILKAKQEKNAPG